MHTMSCNWKGIHPYVQIGRIHPYVQIGRIHPYVQIGRGYTLMYKLEGYTLMYKSDNQNSSFHTFLLLPVGIKVSLHGACTMVVNSDQSMG